MPKVNETYFRERRQYIIDCTQKVLAEKPLEQMNMRDIIRETGFSQGTIYNYYKNMDEIMHAMICQYMHKMKEELEMCMEAAQDFNDCYHRICECMIGLYEGNPRLFQAMLGNIPYHDVMQGSQDILFDIYRVGEEMNGMIMELLKKGIEEGEVRADLNLCIAVFHLWSGIGQTILFSRQKETYIASRFHMTRQEYMEQSFALIIDSIRK